MVDQSRLLIDLLPCHIWTVRLLNVLNTNMVSATCKFQLRGFGRVSHHLNILIGHLAILETPSRERLKTLFLCVSHD